MTSSHPRNRSSRALAALVSIAALLFLVTPEPARGVPGGGRMTGELEKRIREAGPLEPIPVIVQTHGRPSIAHLGRLKLGRGQLKSRHTAIPGYSARVPAAPLAALALDPDVKSISYDTPVRAFMDIAFPAVKAEAAARDFGGLDGTGVGIAFIDTGVMPHPDLANAAGGAVLEVSINGQVIPLDDDFGHGTHVAGILGGTGAASSDPQSFRTFRGISPGARLISVRALAEDGTGSTSNVLAGIDWVIANRGTYNIRVLNLSLGHPVYESHLTDPLCRAVRAATDAGIVVVVAAGNEGGLGSGFGTITSPANEPSVITVGAMDDSDTVATGDDIVAPFSSRGPSLIDYVVKPDIVAPGTWIVSLRAPGSFLDQQYHDLALPVGFYRTDPALAGTDGDYFSLAGTSMAAPFVAGTAALMLQREPGLNPATVKARLMKSAVKDERLAFETGAGFLDIAAALAEGGQAQSAPSPLALPGPDGGLYMQDPALLWGPAWTSSALYGPDKGRMASVDAADVPALILSAYGAIWGGGRLGSLSAIDNNQATGSGLLWSGEPWDPSDSSGSVDGQSAIWGGGGRR